MLNMPLHKKRTLRRMFVAVTPAIVRTLLLGTLAVVCAFPFLFSSLSEIEPLTYRFTLPKTSLNALRYEVASVKEETPTLPARKRQQEQDEHQAKKFVRAVTSARSAPEKAVGTHGNFKTAAASLPAAHMGSHLDSGDKKTPEYHQKMEFIVLEGSDPIKKALVQHQAKDDIHVYMDWPLPATRFSLPNYRSLESVLTQYPNAHVRILMVTPSRAARHDYANTLSSTQFEKYRKRGYDVQFEVLSEKTVLELHEPDRPGFTYFTTVLFPRLEKTIFDESFFTKTENAVQDFKTNHFFRLFSLWRTGGIYTDFSMLFIRPLPPREASWSFPEECGSVTSKTSATDATVHFNDEHWRYSGSQNPYVLHFEAQSPVLGCVLSRFDDKSDTLHECMLKSTKSGSDCLQESLVRCGASSPGAKGDLADHIESFVDWSACNSSQSGKVVPPPSRNVAMLAMAREAMEGSWQVSSNLRALFEKNVYLNRWHPSQVDSHCARQCDFYTHAVARARAPFHQTKFSLSKEDAEASKYICAPSIIIPGAMKAASSSLFAAIAEHPQVLRPIRGQGFKETGTYMNIPGKDHFKHRLQAFPFIEPGENFVAIDGTMYYLDRDESAKQIVADTPNVRAIISLRDPTLRAFDQYRSDFFNGTESFADAAKLSVPILRTCYQEHLAHVDIRALLRHGKASELSGQIDFCTSALMRTPSRRAILTSLYFPQVLRWSSVISKDRLLVVTKEELSRDPEPVLAKVFEFLELCKFKKTFKAENISTMPMPAGYGLTEQALIELNEAFQPWNHALARLVDRQFDWPSPSEALVKAKLQFHRIVIFQKIANAQTTCMDCKRIHAHLAAQKGVNPDTDIEVVALRHDDLAWTDVLKATGDSAKLTDSMPYVFIQGVYVKDLKGGEEHDEGNLNTLVVALSKAHELGNHRTYEPFLDD